MAKPAPSAPAASRGLILALGLLSAFGPLSMDLYLPSLPTLIADLGTTEAMGQATMGASMIGLAFGQLIFGPISDRIGRRVPLIIGVAAFALLSIACAFAPSIELLLLARLLQGLGGSAGIVVSRAIVRDLYQGAEASRAFALLAALLGIAPVIAPLIGGALLLITDWRGLFIALAIIGALLLALAWFAVPETLAPRDRSAAGMREQLSEIGAVVGNGRFIMFTAVLALASLGLFSYISMSSMVFQSGFGFTAQNYALLFAVNAAGMLIGTWLGRAVVRRIGPGRLAGLGILIGTVAAVSFAVLAWMQAPLPALIVALTTMLFVHGLILANVTALAMDAMSRGVGTASAVLGAIQMGIGAIVPPLVSLGGVDAVVMGAVMAAGFVASLVLFLIIAARLRRRSQ